MTLRNLYENGFSINIHCEAVVAERSAFCCHSSHFELPLLIQRFGWDFEIAERREWFLSHFVCSKCGARKATLRLQNPTHVPVYDPAWSW